MISPPSPTWALSPPEEGPGAMVWNNDVGWKKIGCWKKLVVEKSWLLKNLKKFKKNKLLNKVVAIVGCSISFSVSHYREQRGTHHRGRAGRTRGSRSFSILLRGLFFVAGVVGVVGVVFGTVVVNRLLRSHRWKKKTVREYWSWHWNIYNQQIKRHVYNTQRDPSLYVHHRIGMGSYTTSTTSTTNEYKPTCYNPTC